MLKKQLTREKIKFNNGKKVPEIPVSYLIPTFRWPQKSFYGPKIIWTLLLLKAVSLYLITWYWTAVRADVICFEKNGSKAMTRIWYKKLFIRIVMQVWQPIKCRQFTFITFDIYFGEGINMVQKLLSFFNWEGTYVLVEFISHSKHPRSTTKILILQKDNRFAFHRRSKGTENVPCALVTYN